MRYCFLTGLGGVLVLTGCATVHENWAPFPAKDELISFSDQWEAAAKSDNQIVLDLQRELGMYRDKVYLQALQRSKLNWESTGATTYGGLAAVVGGLADQTGLMNSGAGLAALGLTNSSRYKFSEQTQIYLNALKKLSCIQGKVNVVDDLTISWAKKSNDPIARNAAYHFVNTIVASVDTVRAEYTNALLGISPVAMSSEELKAIALRYFQNGAEVAASEDAAQRAFDKAGEITFALVVAVQGCT